MPVPTSSQPVPTTRSASAKQHDKLAPQSVRMDASPVSYGAMTGGAGFSFDRPKSVKFGFNPHSYGSKFYGDGGGDSSATFSTSITMGSPTYGSSFIASASGFNLPPSSLSSSYQRRSYADAAARRQTNPNMLSSSIASLSMSYSNPTMGMSFGSYSYSKHQVHRLIDNPDAEVAGDYHCCGQKHAGLHALLEHVEDSHPREDPDMSTNHGFTPMTHAMDLDLEEVNEEPTLERATSGTGSTRSSLSPHPIPSYPLPPSAGSSKSTTPVEHPVNTPLSISDMLTSPPEVDSKIGAAARSASTCSSPPDGSLATPTTSSQPSPVFAAPKIGGPRTGFLGAVPRMGQQQRFDRAFNEVVAGKKDQPAENQLPGLTAVAPGVLFASAVAGLGIPTTPPTGEKTPGGAQDADATPNAEASSSKTATAEPPLPQPSLFSTHKPWRCPNPGCNKAYKQSNGLKYHQQKGQCDFAIHDAVDLGLTVEEAEERNRPFVCAVGAGCNKRYRQMNGLKYHYLNSGAHGEYGLRMLNNGTHPTPSSVPAATPKRPATLSSPHTMLNTTPTAPARSGAAAPYSIPSRDGRDGAAPRPGPAQPRMGTWGGVKTTQPPMRPFGAHQQPAAPRAPQPLPIQRGRDAVLFAAPDVMDVAGRMDA